MEQIVQDTIISFNEYISKIPNGALYIADQLRSSQVDKANSAINDFAEGIDWLIQVNRTLDEKGFPLDMDLLKLQAHLLEINSGMLQEDYVLVADLFEYEIKPFFENMRGYTI